MGRSSNHNQAKRLANVIAGLEKDLQVMWDYLYYEERHYDANPSPDHIWLRIVNSQRKFDALKEIAQNIGAQL